MSKIEPIKLLEQFYYGKRDYSLLSKAIELFRENQVAKSEPEPTEKKLQDASLKPCPFCGGKVSVVTHGIHKGRWYVRCERPKCNYTYSSALEAAVAWNNNNWYQAEIDRLTAENEELKKRNQRLCPKFADIIGLFEEAEPTEFDTDECRAYAFFDAEHPIEDKAVGFVKRLHKACDEIDRLAAELEAKEAAPEPTVGSDRLREIAERTWPESCAAKGHVLQMADEFDRLSAELETKDKELNDLAESMIFKGNTVFYIYQKMKAYKYQIGIAGSVLCEHGLIGQFEQALAAPERSK